MRVKKVEFHGEDALMIYLTQSENEDEKIKKIIENYKEKIKEVAVFISGSIKIEDVLARIIKDKM